ncbi:Hypothetical_protein [Hexamita inflata]|uniref:Hypothetical_protein n=1 Tax=Hexamita inflata TaxID=28002 RepID=A0AA86QQY0_9EUKA|nr:Hypothetical protein HINF_LOCUS46028 [Hexamita inflata]
MLQSYILSNYSKSASELLYNTSVLDKRIFDNATSLNGNIILKSNILESYIISNYTKSATELLHNTSVLDKRIFDNVSAIYVAISSLGSSSNLESYIISNFSKADANLKQNTTTLDQRIYNNATTLQQQITQLNALMLQMNQSIIDTNQQTQQQQEVVSNVTKYINCTSNRGYVLENGVCVLSFCTIQGQTIQNGACKCLNNNFIVQASTNNCICILSGENIDFGYQIDYNSCACPTPTIQSGNLCVCPAGKTMDGGGMCA